MSQAFAVVIEETAHNFSAYVPDLPGCVASGSSREQVLAEIRDAIAFHLEGLPLTSGCPDRSTWASTLPPWRPDYDIKMRERQSE